MEKQLAVGVLNFVENFGAINCLKIFVSEFILLSLQNKTANPALQHNHRAQQDKEKHSKP
ncbi:MAG: hypothetical protein J5506_06395 [Prevotella sp.]|nr:hypothetical protein [Prevotella sp.]